MPEQSPQNLAETYRQNHAELLEYMGCLAAAIATNYRTEQPRSPEHVGKQEELKAILMDALDIARAHAGHVATDATMNGKEHYAEF